MRYEVDIILQFIGPEQIQFVISRSEKKDASCCSYMKEWLRDSYTLKKLCMRRKGN